MVDSSLKDRVYPRGSSVTLNFTYCAYKELKFFTAKVVDFQVKVS